MLRVERIANSFSKKAPLRASYRSFMKKVNIYKNDLIAQTQRQL